MESGVSEHPDSGGRCLGQGPQRSRKTRDWPNHRPHRVGQLASRRPHAGRLPTARSVTELERLARLYRQERAALLDGASDLLARIQALGEVIDSTDDDYTADVQRNADGVSLTVRPQHPGARPATLRVTLRPLAEQDQDLRDHLDRTIGYGTSDPVRIPQQAVESLHIEGPKILEGDHPPADVELHPASDAPGVGKPLEIRILDEEGAWQRASKAPSPTRRLDRWAGPSRRRCATTESG